uniref:Uncharacterized protein n=1 Tax=Arundo donax TaxID=35708 RepID=A0A0A9AM10_ARUDO
MFPCGSNIRWFIKSDMHQLPWNYTYFPAEAWWVN